MAERCPDCGRLKYDSEHDDFCEVYTELRDARARIAKLEAVVEAQAKVIAEADRVGAVGGWRAYDAAKAELERVKLPPQPQPSERAEDAGERET